MKPILIGLLVAAMTLTGCKKTPAPSQDMAGIENMPGMPAAPADTSGVPLDRTAAASCSKTARSTQSSRRSAMRNRLSPGFTACPSITIFSVISPLRGARSSSVRVTLPRVSRLST